ncbi:SRPBCC family protein [Aeromicrobium piscarium]|uniref:SRPBCC family protein n=1 Tax=Aeromicrobium piscarium TaxID=2590901 RepID=A0A554S7G6_9ACTN|nr:SRPBCC family protein [Aeromicrobium piscarium]TSD62246.1 SRPBCC family protein [Aeromicrobium piscarium]
MTPDDQIDAVRRGVTVTESNDALRTVVQISQSFATTVEDLWDACTDTERLPRWFAPVSGDLELDGRYQIQGNASGTITACHPPNGFSLTWEFAGAISWVEVAIEADGGDRARLTLTHTAGGEDRSFWDTYGPGATGVGWDLSFLGLATHLRDGSSPAQDAANADLAALAPFMRASSTRWADAAVEAGTSEEQARGAEQRTTAFYLGES